MALPCFLITTHVASKKQSKGVIPTRLIFIPGIQQKLNIPEALAVLDKKQCDGFDNRLFLQRFF